GVLFAGGVDVCGQRRPLDRPPAIMPAARAAVCSSAADSFLRDRGAGAGRWSYGWSTAPGAPFVPVPAMAGKLPRPAGGDGLVYRTPADATHHVAFLNPPAAVRYPGGALSLQPGQLALHPGPAGDYAIARWQATEPGRVTVSAEFFGLSSLPPYPATT